MASISMRVSARATDVMLFNQLETRHLQALPLQEAEAGEEMNPITTMEVDERTLVKYRGRHREIAYEISAHRFKKELDRQWDFPCMWATYILLTEEMQEKYKHRIDRAPWNGGVTYERRITEEHISAPADLREKWDKPFYRIGDDFSHFWDHENRMFECYDREYLERHIKRVIDFILDGGAEE